MEQKIEIKLSFIIEGFPFSPESITRDIGIEPTSIWRKGENIAYLNKIRKINAWILSTDKSEDSIEEHLNNILHILEPAKKYIIKNYAKYDIIFSFIINHYDCLPPKLEIPKYLESQVKVFNARIDFDVYGHYKETRREILRKIIDEDQEKLNNYKKQYCNLIDKLGRLDKNERINLVKHSQNNLINIYNIYLQTPNTVEPFSNINDFRNSIKNNSHYKELNHKLSQFSKQTIEIKLNGKKSIEKSNLSENLSILYFCFKNQLSKKHTRTRVLKNPKKINPHPGLMINVLENTIEMLDFN